MARGYLFLAFGKPYVTEVITLVKTIRNTGDTLPASVICSESDIDELNSSNLFDKILVEDFTNPLYKTDCRTSFERYCTIPTILLNEFLIYDETIITDTDMLCQYNPSSTWDIMSSINQAVVLTGKTFSPDWHFGYNHRISKKLGKNVPQSHTGIFYMNKNHKDMSRFFELLIDVYRNYSSYGLLTFYKKSKIDEPIFAVVNALMNYKVIETRENPIITFNYHGEIELPSKKFMVKPNISQFEFDVPPPFIHMFREHSNDYNKLKTRLLS